MALNTYDMSEIQEKSFKNLGPLFSIFTRELDKTAYIAN